MVEGCCSMASDVSLLTELESTGGRDCGVQWVLLRLSVR